MSASSTPAPDTTARARVACVLILSLGALCLTPWLSASLSLLAGVALALTFGNPLAQQTKALTPRLLSLAVIGLGAGMDLREVLRVGWRGLGYTATSLAFVFILGHWLARRLRVERDAGALITAGTAICGGSAIAALTPVLRARAESVSVALGTVFILNALALVLFPIVGHALHLSEAQFGLWSALAIHDTSSVVGASSQFGPLALSVGTTVKLARALWIVPLTLAFAAHRRRHVPNDDGVTAPTKKPWFILGFLLAAALVTFVPEFSNAGHQIELVARRVLVLTLFLIGLGLTKNTLRQVGWRPFAQGLLLWLITASATLASIALNIFSV